MSDKYDDIINLPHHVSKTHPQMSMLSRAAQFSPFAALTGYEGQVKEAARLTDRMVALSDTEIERLDEKLRIIADALSKSVADRSTVSNSTVSITYFVPDERKDGGAYVTATGVVKKIDTVERVIVFYRDHGIGSGVSDGQRIPIDRIVEIEGEILREVDDIG